MITRFPRSGVIGEMDCLYSYWATLRPEVGPSWVEN